MRRAADKYEKDYDRALCSGDIPFLETLVTSGAVDVTNRFKVRGRISSYSSSWIYEYFNDTLLQCNKGFKYAY
jgi:hypothetical protein